MSKKKKIEAALGTTAVGLLLFGAVAATDWSRDDVYLIPGSNFDPIPESALILEGDDESGGVATPSASPVATPVGVAETGEIATGTPDATPVVSPEPTAAPTEEVVQPPVPTQEPTSEPTQEPAATQEPTDEPTIEPTPEPTTTPEPTLEPTPKPATPDATPVDPEETEEPGSSSSNGESDAPPLEGDANGDGVVNEEDVIGAPAPHDSGTHPKEEGPESDGDQGQGNMPVDPEQETENKPKDTQPETTEFVGDNEFVIEHGSSITREIGEFFASAGYANVPAHELERVYVELMEQVGQDIFIGPTLCWRDPTGEWWIARPTNPGEQASWTPAALEFLQEYGRTHLMIDPAIDRLMVP